MDNSEKKKSEKQSDKSQFSDFFVSTIFQKQELSV